MEAAEEKRFIQAEENVLNIAPLRFYKVLGALMHKDRIEEIHFRVGRPVQVIGSRTDMLLTQYEDFSAHEAKIMLESCCGHSVYARENELREGFISLPGGSRVGICGNPVYIDGRIARFMNVSSFNFRIAREVRGCAEKFMHLFVSKGRPVSVLVSSRPGVGKTTLLRDCARCLSDGIGVSRPFKVAIADERNEISGSFDGAPVLDVGMRTDVMAGIPKSAAMPMLIRSMAPEVIITDELSGAQEAQSISEAVKRGVAVIASVHAGSAAELRQKTHIVNAVRGGLFKRVLLLERNGTHFSAAQIDLQEM